MRATPETVPRGMHSSVKMLTQADVEAATLWVKDFMFSPTFDEDAIRLTIALRGHILVGRDEAEADEIVEQQETAWAGIGRDPKYEDMLQRSPLEFPVAAVGKEVEVLQVMVIILQAWGASTRASNLAPPVRPRVQNTIHNIPRLNV